MRVWKVYAIISFGLFFLVGSNQFVSANFDSQKSIYLEGRLSIIWGDPIPDLNMETFTQYYLTDIAGNIFELHFDDGGDIGGRLLDLQGQVVRVSGRQLVTAEQNVIFLEEIMSVNTQNPTSTQVTGSQPWISIMCKFSDQADEPENLAYFIGMYANVYPGLNHYWREQSYNQINLDGSGAAGWFVLPYPESYYNPSDTQGGTDRSKLRDDCIGVADASINFAPYTGINMMFNTDFDNGYAWGGYAYFTIDGVYKRWNLTWEPPWGYRNISVMGHETGHGFGLPHSTYFSDGNGDGYDDNVYDNRWDVMSSTWSNNLVHPTYGVVGQHTIVYHKDRLNWIEPGEKFIPSMDSRTSITLEQLAQPQTSNYKMVQIPIDGSSTHFYTVEARRLVGYDAALPGNAVIIHEVNSNWRQPAHVIDIDGDGDTSDGGARWAVGETFTDAINNISVSVDLATSSGYVVTIQLGNPTSEPGDFSKLSPINGASNQPTNLTLTWESAADASSYEYCFDTTNDNTCSNWVSTGTETSASLNGLAENTAYFWQVRVVNSGGSTYANGSATAFWSFTTLLNPPQAFDKLSPANGTSGKLTTLLLTWQSSSNAASYEYCYDTSNDNACSNWISVGNATSVWLSTLNLSTTYYWHVRAINASGTVYSNSSDTAFWSFTTAATIYEIFLPLVNH